MTKYPALLLLSLSMATFPQALGAEGAFSTTGLIMSSDMQAPGGNVRIFDPINGNIVFDFNTLEHSGDICGVDAAICTPMGISHVVHDGQDYLDMAIWVRYNGSSGGSEQADTFIQRVKIGEVPEVVWRIESLNFSGAPNGDAYCKQSPQDACGDSTRVGHARSYCNFDWLHSIQIIDDRPEDKQVTVVVAEGYQSAKYLQVSLDYTDGNSCAEVDWVFGTLDSNYPWVSSPSNGVLYAQPNSARVYDEPGGPYLLASYYGVDTSPMGSWITMYKWNERIESWDLAWRFPEAVPGVSSNLNIVHMAEFHQNEATGERFITYNHSSSTSPSWGEGSQTTQGGSWGVLVPGALLSDPPTYLYDAVNFAATHSERAHYPRDFDILSDGTWLLTDSSCENQSACDKMSRFLHTQPLAVPSEPTDKDGYYVPTSSRPRAPESELNIVTIPEESIIAEYGCGVQIAFEGEFLPWDSIGSSLKALAATSERPCPVK